MTLDGRVALVTGSGRGVGRSIALALAADGADVAVNYSRDANGADEVAAAIVAMGRRAVVVRGDVASLDDIEMMVANVVEELGPISILVHNAGVASRGNPVVTTSPDEVERLIAIHAIAAHHLCRLVVPGMRSATRGDIVMISSVATKMNSACGAPYNMAKAALEALAFTLAKEEVGHGIHVNIVAPGLVDTEMGRRLVKATSGADDIRELDAQSPFGHVCQPEEVAGVVSFLCSDQAGYVTAQRIYIDGGAND
jgi:NAD(P)-dependent dehydrogenase (short-subunit alcohol dehydrogenase family)